MTCAGIRYVCCLGETPEHVHWVSNAPAVSPAVIEAYLGPDHATALFHH
jgi:hypothetical protein